MKFIDKLWLSLLGGLIGALNPSVFFLIDVLFTGPYVSTTLLPMIFLYIIFPSAVVATFICLPLLTKRILFKFNTEDKLSHLSCLGYGLVFGMLASIPTSFFILLQQLILNIRFTTLNDWKMLIISTPTLAGIGYLFSLPALFFTGYLFVWVVETRIKAKQTDD